MTFLVYTSSSSFLLLFFFFFFFFFLWEGGRDLMKKKKKQVTDAVGISGLFRNVLFNFQRFTLPLLKAIRPLSLAQSDLAVGNDARNM